MKISFSHLPVVLVASAALLGGTGTAALALTGGGHHPDSGNRAPIDDNHPATPSPLATVAPAPAIDDHGGQRAAGVSDDVSPSMPGTTSPTHDATDDATDDKGGSRAPGVSDDPAGDDHGGNRAPGVSDDPAGDDHGGEHVPTAAATPAPTPDSGRHGGGNDDGAAHDTGDDHGGSGHGSDG